MNKAEVGGAEERGETECFLCTAPNPLRVSQAWHEQGWDRPSRLCLVFDTWIYTTAWLHSLAQVSTEANRPALAFLGYRGTLLVSGMAGNCSPLGDLPFPSGKTPFAQTMKRAHPGPRGASHSPTQQKVLSSVLCAWAACCLGRCRLYKVFLP